MLLFEGQNIEYKIHERTLLDIKNIKVHRQDRIGLVGRNGSGKTTLLNIIGKEKKIEQANLNYQTSVQLIPQLKTGHERKSGGEVTQRYIQSALNQEAGLLLLDEPTTNLDTVHIEWLEKVLKTWRGAIIIVSHDRTFLDQLCREIWALEEGKLSIYKGNYSDYAQAKALEREQQALKYERYEKEKQAIKAAIRMKEAKAQAATKKPKNLSASEARIKGAKPYFANKQKKLRKTVSAFETKLDQLETVEKPREGPQLKMDAMNEAIVKDKIIIRVTQLEGKVAGRLLWSAVDFYVRSGEKIAIIGANGVGKTTLINHILQAQKESTHIECADTIEFGYFSQAIDILDTEETILENVTKSSHHDETFIRIVLARMQFIDADVHKRVGVLSGGEKVKVALSKIFLSRANVLVLDEPTNFLDIEALEALEELLSHYQGTILFVSHDRMFVDKIATKILEIKNKSITVFDGGLSDYKKQGSVQKTRHDEAKLLLETKITDVLSRLSIEPSKELEAEFQHLLREKNKYER